MDHDTGCRHYSLAQCADAERIRALRLLAAFTQMLSEEGRPVEYEVKTKRVVAQPIAYTLHVGSYAQIRGAYRAVAAWIQSHGHELAGAPREVYLTDPAQTPEADFRTEIDWPIAA